MIFSFITQIVFFLIFYNAINLTNIIIYTTVLSGPRIWLADKSVDIRVQQNSHSRFTVCITPLVEVAVFLTASVMADTQIHYNFKNNTVSRKQFMLKHEE